MTTLRLPTARHLLVTVALVLAAGASQAGGLVSPGGRLFKVGTGRAQRVFKVSPWHDGASFELVRVEEHGTD